MNFMYVGDMGGTIYFKWGRHIRHFGSIEPEAGFGAKPSHFKKVNISTLKGVISLESF